MPAIPTARATVRATARATARARLRLAALLAALALASGVPAAATVVVPLQLSNNAVEDGRPKVSEPEVAWQRGNATDEEIVRFDGAASQNVTANAVRDFQPEISDGNVIWKRTTNSIDCELYFWNGVDPAFPLDSSFACENDIRIAGDHVVWAGDGPAGVADIHLYTGSLPEDTFGSALRQDRQPRVGDVLGDVRAVWVDNDGLWYYDGSDPPLLIGPGQVMDPEMHGEEAVWSEFDGDDWEVWWTDGSTTTQVTDNDVDDVTPDVAGGNVVWVSEGEIWLWNGATADPLTSDALDDHSPRVSLGAAGATVAWVRNDGNDGEIWVFDGCETAPVTDDSGEDDQVDLDGNTVVWRSAQGGTNEVWQAVFGCDAVCGDGELEPPVEECDDSNTADGDGCDSMCLLEVCGNGAVQVGEECDDGNTVDGDGCDAACLRECGNGVFDPALEECDDGNATNGDGCDANCLVEECGNGRQEAGEECDDGNTAALDGCDASCLLECGNGVVEPAEGCDDGNTTPGDGCDESCIAEVCGNGVLQVGEECDDGNLQDSDGCSSACVVEAPASKAQQKCINEMNKRGAKLAKVQNKEDVACLKNAGKGKVEKLGTPATAQDCLTNDPNGKVAKTAAKTVSGEGKKCDPADLPGFAYTDAATVNTAAVDEMVALAGDVFGPDLGAAVIDKAADPVGARCQLEVAKRQTKVADTLFKLANQEKKRLIAGKPDGTLALSNAVLQLELLGYLQADVRGKIAKKEGQTVSKTASRCATVDLMAAFPGCAAGSLGPLADCANEAARCRFCRAMNAMDGLAMDCDDFDDGVLDASCP